MLNNLADLITVRNQIRTLVDTNPVARAKKRQLLDLIADMDQAFITSVSNNTFDHSALDFVPKIASNDTAPPVGFMKEKELQAKKDQIRVAKEELAKAKLAESSKAETKPEQTKSADIIKLQPKNKKSEPTPEPPTAA